MSAHPLWWRVVHNVGLRSRLTQRIVFVHPPKCGGTSIFHAIKRAYGVRALLNRAAFAKLDNGASYRAALLQDRDPLTFRHGLLAYFLAGEARFIYGHFPAPGPELEELLREWGLVTVLRDPTERWFSHYFFHPGIDSGDRSSAPDRLGALLSAFLRDEPERARAMGENYVAMFGGGSVPAAEEALARFDVVGRVEDLAGFVELFRSRFGAKLDIRRLNVGKGGGRNASDLFDADLVERVRRLCRPNQQLYDAVSGRRNT